MTSTRPRRLARIALLAALTAVAAQIAVPLPFTAVPFTLQVVAVLLAGLLLGPSAGLWSQTAYIGLGLAGAPVFANFRGGPGELFGVTGGYLWAMPVAALVAGRLSGTYRQRPLSFRRALAAGLAALAVIYAGGTIGLQVYYKLGLGAALAQGVVPFIAADAVKAVLAAMLAVRLRKALYRLN